MLGPGEDGGHGIAGVDLAAAHEVERVAHARQRVEESAVNRRARLIPTKKRMGIVVY